MGEAQYLQEQSRHAKAAMRAALRGMKHDVAQAADPRQWAQAHPWMTVTAAAAAGFAVTTVVGRPARPECDRAEEAHDSATNKFLSAAEKITSLTRLLVSAILMAQAAKSYVQDDSNGHPQPDSVVM